MLRIAVCDDEAVAAKSIAGVARQELTRMQAEFELSVLTDSRALAQRLEKGEHFDLLLADIDMPELDGIRLGTMYRHALRHTLLVYISNREDLVFDAFLAEPFRFVRKKHYQTKLPIALHDAVRELREQHSRKIAFPCGASNTVLLLPERISFVAALKKKQLVHYGAETYEINSSFQRVMEQLSGYGFVQTHKSFLVNRSFIHFIEKTELTLDDGTKIPISRSYFKQVQDAFARYAMDFKSAT